MSWRNEPDEPTDVKRAAPRVGSIVSYALVAFAILSVLSTLRFGSIRLSSTVADVRLQASCAMAWHCVSSRPGFVAQLSSGSPLG